MALTMEKSVTHGKNHRVYEAAGDAADDILFTLTPEECDEFDSYFVMSTVGVVTVEVTLNGVKWNPIALQDVNGTLIDQATVTTQDGLYAFVGRPHGIRVKASGGAAQAALSCWAAGRKG